MERQVPRTTSDEIDLYIRTCYSLLRTSGEVRVRAFEEAHAFSRSSLHAGARAAEPDVAAFAYSAARLPACMPQVRRVVLGQSHEQFEAADHEVSEWVSVRTRGRRRPLRWDGGGTLAAFVTSTSDIDDLVPIVTAYQIEWNKMHHLLAAAGRSGGDNDDTLTDALRLNAHDVDLLRQALGPNWQTGLRAITAAPCDLSLRLLAGSFLEYQRAAQRWWHELEPAYLRAERPRRRPVYFVSSNTHCLANLLGGWARTHRDALGAWVAARDPEGLASTWSGFAKAGDATGLDNLAYYLLGRYLKEAGTTGRVAEVQAWDAAIGLRTIETPGQIDVAAQVIELGRIDPNRLDPRVRVPGIERLAASDAVVINIDYPLGMAAYHHLSRLAQGVGELRGVYVMGKAATLNGRVGDIMISSVAHDEHSRNTYLFRNCFGAADVAPWAREGTVLDGQKALTVRSAFLQNREYMSVFYREGYTVLEMEAGPYLSSIFELSSPGRHPHDEIVHLSNVTPFDVGILHYASDTPYSRRQSLLSKSLSFFGVESTYACAIAITRRIFSEELARV